MYTFSDSSYEFQILIDSQPSYINFRAWEPWESCPSCGFKYLLFADDSHIYISSSTSGLKSSLGYLVVNSYDQVSRFQTELLTLPLRLLSWLMVIPFFQVLRPKSSGLILSSAATSSSTGNSQSSTVKCAQNLPDPMSPTTAPSHLQPLSLP